MVAARKGARSCEEERLDTALVLVVGPETPGLEIAPTGTFHTRNNFTYALHTVLSFHQMVVRG